MVALETRELVRRAARLEQGAWDALVDQYKRLVWAILRKVEGLDRATQEDLYQEVFVALARGGMSQFRGETEWEFRTFLRTITRNKIRDHHRAQSRRREAPEEEGDGAQPDPSWSSPGARNPEENAATRQVLDHAVRCMQELTDIDRQVFLRRAEGYPYDEIAAVLGLPQGTVASKYHRAKAKVEECMRRAGVLEEASIDASEPRGDKKT